MLNPFGPVGDMRILQPGTSAHLMVLNPQIERMAALVVYLSPYVDEFVIIDTGSSDEDVEIMEGWNYPGFPPVRVYRETFEDFSTTRNKGLLRHNYEWTVGFDVDELPSMQMMAHIALASTGRGMKAAPEARGWQYYTMNWWNGILGEAHDYHWHVRLWRTRGSFLYRPVHELVAIGGLSENILRNTSACPKAPVEAYLIHSKGKDDIIQADELYSTIGEVSR